DDEGRKPGVDDAGSDGVDANAQPGELQRRRLHHRDLAGLRRVVGKAARLGLERVGRRGQDDRTADAVAHHHPRGLLCEVPGALRCEGPCHRAANALRGAGHDHTLAIEPRHVFRHAMSPPCPGPRGITGQMSTTRSSSTTWYASYQLTVPGAYPGTSSTTSPTRNGSLSRD